MVSVIIPIYNVENYITRCVKSVQNQTYNDIEIILVDDGSPDKSGRIIDEIARYDSRIKVIHKSNRGVSSARNAGLDNASGEWVSFVDGDDWVETDYISYLLDTAERIGCDIVMGHSFFTIDNSDSYDKEYSVTSTDAQRRIYNGDIFVAVWNKLYNLNLLKKHNIRFNEDIWYGEGMLFNIQCLQYVDKVAIGEKAVYHQTFNPNSAMRSFNLKSNYCGLKSMDIQGELLSDKSVIKEWRYHRYRFNRSIIDGLIRSKQEVEHKEDLDKCIHDLRKNLWIPLTTEKSLKMNLIWILYSICPRKMAQISANHFKERVRKVGETVRKLGTEIPPHN